MLTFALDLMGCSRPSAWFCYKDYVLLLKGVIQMLTPARPWNQYAVALVAHGMDHAFERIGCPSREHNVLGVDDMNWPELGVAESSQGVPKLSMATLKEQVGRAEDLREVREAACRGSGMERTSPVALSSTVVLRNSSSSGRSSSFWAPARSTAAAAGCEWFGGAGAAARATGASSLIVFCMRRDKPESMAGSTRACIIAHA